MVKKQWIESGAVFEEIYNAAELYWLYEDLYDLAYIKPCTMLDVMYKQEEVIVPVYKGNVVSSASLVTSSARLRRIMSW